MPKHGINPLCSCYLFSIGSKGTSLEMQIVNGGLTPSNPLYNIVSHHENLAIKESTEMFKNEE